MSEFSFKRCECMNYWNRKLQEEINNAYKTYDCFAIEAKVSKSTLTDLFKYNKEVSMFSVFKMAKVLFPDRRDIHEECCINIFTQYERNVKINMKRLFVIAYLNGYSSILKYLVDLSSSHTDCNVKKYSPLFKLFYERPRGGNPKEHILCLEDIRKTIPKKENLDMEIFCDILYLLSSGDIGDFGMFDTYKDRVVTNISKVKNQDLKLLYNYWITDIWSYALLRKLKVNAFREQNNKLMMYENIQYFPVMSAMNNLRIGESFLFSDYQKSYEYTLKAIEELENKCDFKYRIAINNMNFLKLIHNIEIDTINLEQLHPAELALYFVLREEYLKAIEILMKLKNKNKKLTPIQYCYLGQAKMDLDIIAESKKLFIENGDYFFAQYATKAYNDCEKLLKCGGVK